VGTLLRPRRNHILSALAAIDDAPPVISILGNIDHAHRCCVGVVGARNSSLNGRKFAEKISRDLGESGQVIVSGLARGIDTAAHAGSLKTGTIAVVAGGIDIIYPEENKNLYEQIREQGLIIAESPLGVPPVAQSFPRRNRIVSGLSKGVVVIEATMRSGS
jgi:DNA processing protein